MPSGAKRRKAAKKKKDKNPSNNNITSTTTTTYSNGNDDLKTQESDSSEFSSPASQDNNQSHNPFSKEGKRDASPVRSNAPEHKSKENVQDNSKDSKKTVGKDEGNGESATGLKSAKVSGIRDVTIKRDNGVKESRNGNSNGNKNNESQNLQKNSVGIKPFVDSVQPAKYVPEKVIEVSESASVQDTENTERNELETRKMQEKSLPSVAESGSKVSEEKKFSFSDDNSGKSSSAMDSTLRETEDKLLPPSNAPISETSDGVGRMKDSDIPEYSGYQPLVATAPQLMQKTSWKGCCGLFEVLSGSNR